MVKVPGSILTKLPEQVWLLGDTPCARRDPEGVRAAFEGFAGSGTGTERARRNPVNMGA
jgi:hypothetical protein